MMQRKGPGVKNPSGALMRRWKRACPLLRKPRCQAIERSVPPERHGRWDILSDCTMWGLTPLLRAWNAFRTGYAVADMIFLMKMYSDALTGAGRLWKRFCLTATLRSFTTMTTASCLWRSTATGNCCLWERILRRGFWNYGATLGTNHWSRHR